MLGRSVLAGLAAWCGAVMPALATEAAGPHELIEAAADLDAGRDYYRGYRDALRDVRTLERRSWRSTRPRQAHGSGSSAWGPGIYDRGTPFYEPRLRQPQGLAPPRYGDGERSSGGQAAPRRAPTAELYDRQPYIPRYVPRAPVYAGEPSRTYGYGQAYPPRW